MKSGNYLLFIIQLFLWRGVNDLVVSIKWNLLCVAMIYGAVGGSCLTTLTAIIVRVCSKMLSLLKSRWADHEARVVWYVAPASYGSLKPAVPRMTKFCGINSHARLIIEIIWCWTLIKMKSLFTDFQ